MSASTFHPVHQRATGHLRHQLPRLLPHPGASRPVHPRRSRPARLACSLLLAAAVLPVRAQPEPGPELQPTTGVARAPGELRTELPTLQAAYLDCERAATERLMSFGEAAACSQLGEALLTQGFDRDFGRLLAWWRSEKRLHDGATVTPCDDPKACNQAPATARAPRAGDHPAVVVQRLHAQQGYDYLARFYPHPAWLYLLPEAPRTMTDHPAVIVFRRDQEQQKALAEAAQNRAALLAEQRMPR